MTAYIRNNKTLVLIITVLLVSNLFLLFSFIQKDKRDKREEKEIQPQSRREFMIKTLKDSIGFNDEQITKYEQMADKHKEMIKPMFDNMQQNKENLYKLLLQSEVPDSVVNNYLDKIGNGQRSIDEKVYYHFNSLKALCTQEQRPRFDSVTQKIIKRMISPYRKGGHGDKDKNKKPH